MQFWAILGRNPLLHPLKTAKPFYGKQECPKKGHAAPDPSPVAPLKTAKPFYGKQECPKKGHAAPDPGAGCTP